MFGNRGTGLGAVGKTYGFPRFREAVFEGRFPFGTVRLSDEREPLAVTITGWSPFVPGDADACSLPVAALEYRFTNRGDEPVDALFSFSSMNFMALGNPGAEGARVDRIEGGFKLVQEQREKEPHAAGAFAAFLTEPGTRVNAAWFRGGWWDPLTIAWKEIASGRSIDRPPHAEGGPSRGATLSLPFRLAPGEERTIRLHLAWYVPFSNLRAGSRSELPLTDDEAADPTNYYRPWYASVYRDIDEVIAMWKRDYDELKARSERLRDTLFGTTLPPEVVDAVTANLSILKSPTVLRQHDGKFWAWEGCNDSVGSCHGTCTHVWGYAQALPNLLPELERGVRETEFFVSQDERGHQTFRTPLPIRPPDHEFHAAADGQLGGIIRVYREWRISGDDAWLRTIWPKVRQSLDYCIETWDPDRVGALVEPHHNTYDIEFWGPDGMCGSIYLGALRAAVAMGEALGDDVEGYRQLADRAKAYLENELFERGRFIQKVRWEGLRAGDPTDRRNWTMVGQYSPEAEEILRKEGPKYQYGMGCLSDGVIGAWMAEVAGLGSILDREKVRSHLRSVFEHNFRTSLSRHENAQRPGFAQGDDAGLLLCSWPEGDQPSLHLVYADEVWTGIEYQVASHMFREGLVSEGLAVVRAARDRYDGRIRNPYNEYECGHWYARALASFALNFGLTGVRYDKVEKRLYVEPVIEGDFRTFVFADGGYGFAGVRGGEPYLEVVEGSIEVKEIVYRPRERVS